MAGKFNYKVEEGLECVLTVGGSIKAGVVMKRSYNGHGQYTAGKRKGEHEYPAC